MSASAWIERSRRIAVAQQKHPMPRRRGVELRTQNCGGGATLRFVMEAASAGSGSPAAGRRAAVKTGISAEGGRGRRKEAVSSIRKNKRVENLRKRRGRPATAPSGVSDSGAIGDVLVTAAAVSELPALCVTLQGNHDRGAQHIAAEKIRRMLSKEKDPPAKPVIDSGALPWLTAVLLAHDAPKLQLEAAWALTNVASTQYTGAVVDCGAVLPLTKLLRSADADLREQCIWCLGNIAGDSAALRDRVLAVPGTVASLQANLHAAATASLLRNATWTASNFCRGTPSAPLSAIAPLFPDLITLAASTDCEVRSDALWALSYASNGGADAVASLIGAGAVPRLIDGILAARGNASVLTPTLRTLGNAVTGSDEQTQVVVDNGGVSALCTVMRHEKKAIRKEAMWALSNIAAGTPAQIAALLSLPGIVDEVKRIVVEDAPGVASEAIWTLSNLCTGGSAAVVAHLVQCEVVEVLCAQLHEQNRRHAKTVEATLDALIALLGKHGAAPGNGSAKAAHEEAITVRIEECGGIELIELLQEHSEESIYLKAIEMIEKFFGEESDDSVNTVEEGHGAPFAAPSAFGAVPPAISPGNTFSFADAFGGGGGGGGGAAAAAGGAAAPPAVFGAGSFSFGGT